MALTSEQQLVVDTMLSTKDSRIVAVNAVAGSGKTSTAEAVIKAYKPKNGLYTAFNKAIVTDSSKRFGKLIESKTMHALAYKFIKPKKGIEDLNYLTIKEDISYDDKATVINTLDNFFRSSSVDIEEYALSQTGNQDLVSLSVKYANMMLEGSIPPTFNFMLKCMHIMLLHGEIEVDFDLLILDECLVGSTMVATSTHDRTIASICNSLIRGEEVFVKSFNENTSKFEYKKALNPLISHNRGIIEVVTEGLNKVECTANHKFLTQRGYVQAVDLVIGKDYILLDTPAKQKTKVILNSDQYQVMLGSYLGDGSLNKRSNFNTYRLRFTQGEKQLGYLKWKTDAFNLTKSIHLMKSGYTGKTNVYQSNSSSTFILDDTPFNLVLKDLDVLGLAVWYMDDGSKDRISSNNFSKEDNTRLRDMLIKKFKLYTDVRYDGKGYFYLSLNKKNAVKLQQLIKDYLHQDVAYKLNTEGILPTSLDNAYKPYGGNFVTSKSYMGIDTVYDFEVEDNHNFLVSKSKNSTKMIVHNCQDTTAVVLEIFKLVNADKKIMFGDKYQNIYSFMDTVNAFEELTDVNNLFLTKSFRCDLNIASIVEDYGKTHLENSFTYRGNEALNSNSCKVAYITRTNAALIERMYKLLIEGNSFTLTRNINEIFSLPISLLNASLGKEVYDKKYKYLQNEYKNYLKVRSDYRSFFDYVATIVENPVVTNTAKTLLNFSSKRINIYDLKNKVKELKPCPNTILTTAHAFKGLEADVVHIEDDLNYSVSCAIKEINTLKATYPEIGYEELKRDFLSKEQKENLNTYYVALSRAKSLLHNVRY